MVKWLYKNVNSLSRIVNFFFGIEMEVNYMIYNLLTLNCTVPYKAITRQKLNPIELLIIESYPFSWYFIDVKWVPSRHLLTKITGTDFHEHACTCIYFLWLYYLVLFKKLSKQLYVYIYECIKTGWSWPFLDQLLIFNGWRDL